jgi:uncharacterized membrane protein YdjX (TVP38/TMEM64 family)
MGARDRARSAMPPRRASRREPPMSDGGLRRQAGISDGAVADASPRPSPRAGGHPLWIRIAIGVALLLALAGAYWALSESGLLSALESKESLRREIDRLGMWGPLAIVALLTVAIVMSPIPSGPIAIVAGAAFGPVWGTLYVVIGAELGALIAFAIARHLGYEALKRWPAARALLDRLGESRSQTRLMAVVFVSRLVPFISFDAVSYAAGLTPLAFWRFALATLAGVAPISFLLAYFGEEMVSAQSDGWMLVLLLAGGITLVPIAIKLARDRFRAK